MQNLRTVKETKIDKNKNLKIVRLKNSVSGNFYALLINNSLIDKGLNFNDSIKYYNALNKFLKTKKIQL